MICNMTLDQALVPAVSHYIGGRIGSAMVILQEVQVKGELPELIAAIDTSRASCLSSCNDLIVRPGIYAKQQTYQLSPQDRDFLQMTRQKIEQSHWRNLKEVQELSDFVDAYCQQGNMLR